MHTTTTLCKQLRNTAFRVCVQHAKYTLAFLTPLLGFDALDSSSTGPLQQFLTETLHMTCKLSQSGTTPSKSG